MLLLWLLLLDTWTMEMLLVGVGDMRKPEMLVVEDMRMLEMLVLGLGDNINWMLVS